MSAAQKIIASFPAVPANEPDVTLAPAFAANEQMSEPARSRRKRREYTMTWAAGVHPTRGEDVLVAWLRSLASGIHVVDCGLSNEREESR